MAPGRKRRVPTAQSGDEIPMEKRSCVATREGATGGDAQQVVAATSGAHAMSQGQGGTSSRSMRLTGTQQKLAQTNP